jgi:SPP1 family predicted phage head-tail adaptor
MQAGKLSRKIKIQRATETVSPSGSASKAWADLYAIRAEIVQQSSSEYLTGYGEADDGTIIFRVRFRPGVTTDDRVLYDGRPYDLKEIKEIGRRRGLELRGVSTA